MMSMNDDDKVHQSFIIDNLHLNICRQQSPLQTDPRRKIHCADVAMTKQVIR